MSSFKSLVTLVILATIGGYLYLKITETEPIIPPEAAELSFDVPQIDMGSGDFAEPAGAGVTAPAYAPSSETTDAPAWSPPPVSAPPVNQSTDAASPVTAQANTEPPAIDWQGARLYPSGHPHPLARRKRDIGSCEAVTKSDGPDAREPEANAEDAQHIVCDAQSLPVSLCRPLS